MRDHAYRISQVVSPFQAILDYERANGIPEGYINATISALSPHGAWQRLERGEILLDEAYFNQFQAELRSPVNWKAYWAKQQGKNKQRDATTALPPVPPIDARALFWEMMRVSRAPDPYMYPALHKLRASGKFIMAALSNTVIFPVGIKDDKGVVFSSSLHFTPEQAKLFGSLAASDTGVAMEGTPIGSDIRSVFDTYVSSAHVGMRKPDPDIYKLAIKQLDEIALQRGKPSITAGDILFLDDIGQNLRTAKQVGMRTLKVQLGRNIEAVKELERITGVKLLEDEKARL